jgi:ribose transport system ATP-binding protein
MSFLEMSGIAKRFAATVALDKVDFAVEKGEVHALVGENGSGKSTLMRILAGAIQPDGGEMRLAGVPFRPRNPMDSRRRGVAMIHQELSLCPHLSIAENIMLGVEAGKAGVLDLTSIRRRSVEALAKLGHGDLDVDQALGRLPIAMRQIVEIARAVAAGSEVVVLDEPTSSLSEADVESLFRVISTLRSAGHAIIYISHFLDEIPRVADRLTVLRDGSAVGTRPVAGTGPDEVVSMMVGRTIEELYPRSERQPGETLLDVTGLSGAKRPIGAGLALRRGEVLGIAGLNGSGRTELLRTLFGLDPVKSGRIRIGVYSGAASPGKRWAQSVGLLSEDRKLEGLALGMTIADNVTLAGLDRLSRFGVLSVGRQARAADEWAKRLDIKCRDGSQAVWELSGGNQQKVALARLMLNDVDLLLLDEPTRGIDVGSKEQIYALIDRVALGGKAVLIVSSYLPELLGVCDRIAVMHKGRLGEAKDARTATAEQVMMEATGS